LGFLAKVADEIVEKNETPFHKVTQFRSVEKRNSDKKEG